MKVLLPSRGIIGFKSVDLRQPKYKDIKYLHNVEDIDIVLKTEFLKPLIDKSILELTTWDRDYLFTIAISSMNNNKLKYSNLTCPYCNELHSYEHDLEKVDIYDLPIRSELNVKITVNGGDWNLKVPQVKDELDCIDLCTEMNGEFNQKLYDNLMISKIISSTRFKPCYTEYEDFLESMKALPVNVYMAGHAFFQLSFHGIESINEVECPSCKRTRKVRLNNSGRSVRFSTETIMDIYSGVSSILSYSEFMDMSIPEHKALIKSINKSNEQSS